MYTIHQNPGFIIDTMDTGEKNRFFWIFTQDFGLINASAQGVRSTTSKLNPFLQQYSFSVLEFVKGKDVWRITNALAFQEEQIVFTELSKLAQESLARIALLLRRLYVGEESHSQLFFELYEGVYKLTKTYDSETIQAVEILIMIKILYHLGYWEEFKESYTLHAHSYTRETLDRISQRKIELQARIKQSLSESHL